jgi:putative DeoR family transcriptional regulator (stage III sporulation protein D)
MNDFAYDRAQILGRYIAETGATVRATAFIFKISKSTVHKDVSQRLKRIDPPLYRCVKEVLLKNKAERHIRGGAATRQKYRLSKSKNTDGR